MGEKIYTNVVVCHTIAYVLEISKQSRKRRRVVDARGLPAIKSKYRIELFKNGRRTLFYWRCACPI